MRHGFDPNQPRGHDGQWTDGPDGDVSVVTMGGDGRHRPELPADPMSALMDVDNDYSTDALLDDLAAGHGTPGERAGMVAALKEFRALARAYNGPVAGLSEMDFRVFINSERAWGDDPPGNAKEILGIIGDDPKDRAFRAAVLARLEEVRRERATRAPVGMAAGPQFTSGKEAGAWAQEHMPSPELTPAQQQAAYGYTQVDFRAVNAEARAGEPPSAQTLALDTAIGTSTVPDSLLLMRGEGEAGLRSLGVDPYDPASLAGLVGTTVADRAFLSTSVGTRPGGAGSAGGLITWLIRTPPGTPGLYLDRPGLTAWPGEHEVLLPRGTRRLGAVATRGRLEGVPLVSLEQRWAADPVELHRDSAHPRQPRGPVSVSVVREGTGPALGLLWTDGTGRRGYLPHPVGSPETADAANFAGRVLAVGGPAERFHPLYAVEPGDTFPTLRDACATVLR